MRKVMIVDDETLVRIGMQTIIDWEKEGYRLAGVYGSGEEALEAVRRDPPDVILTDIRMNGMDGFGLIDAVQKSFPSVQFIILSSYEDFEYTRQAIRKGVHDYIPKHRMEPDDLLHILNAMTYKESAERRSDPLDAEKEELLEKVREPDFAFDAGAFPLLHARLAGGGRTVRWMHVGVWSGEEAAASAGRKAFAALAAEVIGRWKQAELIGADDEALHAVIVYGDDERGEAPDDLPQRMFRELEYNIREKLNERPVMGVGRVAAPAGDALARSMAEASAAAGRAFYDGSGVYFADSVPERGRGGGEEKRYALYRSAKALIAADRPDEFGDAWFGAVMAEPGLPPTQADWLGFADMLHTLLIDTLVERYRPKEETIRLHMESMRAILTQAKQAGTFDAFRSRVMAMAAEMKAAAAGLRQERGWIRKVTEWISGHYAEPIRLEEAAEHVNFSVGYFSQRFHQETGMVFTDYVARYRIGKAIDLLRTTDYSTDEIAHLVGFVNANYFVRVFKKVTGSTLSEFKSRTKDGG